MSRAFALTLIALAGIPACSTMGTVFATGEKKSDGPISNPFEGYNSGPTAENGTTFKTRRGDQSFEVTFPDQNSKLDEVSMPTRSAAADEGIPSDDPYKNRKPAMADREIADTFPKTGGEFENERNDIETTLGVMPSADSTPRADKSYLAGLDRIKRLYRDGRYEASLLEVEDLLVDFPTAPKLYEMRGTLLDRLGRAELAFRSWQQALRLEPMNASLKKYLDRKRATRGLASESEGAKP
jgi:tetratricopeptide (TPR) repeat protein